MKYFLAKMIRADWAKVRAKNVLSTEQVLARLFPLIVSIEYSCF